MARINDEVRIVLNETLTMALDEFIAENSDWLDQGDRSRLIELDPGEALTLDGGTLGAVRIVREPDRSVEATVAAGGEGVTEWSYRVPYCDSIQHAFNSLRWEVFQARQYRGDKAARSIYSLRRQQGAEGTHSILDMQWLQAEPGFEVVSPLTPQQLLGLFGSMRPTREALEGVELPTVPRNEGRYVIVYHRNQPREILFFGRSGARLAS